MDNIDAWKEVKSQLILAITLTRDSINAEKAKRRFLLEELYTNLTPQGTLAASSQWTRKVATPNKKGTKRKKKTKNQNEGNKKAVPKSLTSLTTTKKKKTAVAANDVVNPPPPIKSNNDTYNYDSATSSSSSSFQTTSPNNYVTHTHEGSPSSPGIPLKKRIKIEQNMEFEQPLIPHGQTSNEDITIQQNHHQECMHPSMNMSPSSYPFGIQPFPSPQNNFASSPSSNNNNTFFNYQLPYNTYNALDANAIDAAAAVASAITAQSLSSQGINNNNNNNIQQNILFEEPSISDSYFQSGFQQPEDYQVLTNHNDEDSV